MNKNLKPYVLISPVAILVGLVMFVGIFNCLTQSLGYFPQVGMDTITLDYYKEVLGDSAFLKSLLFSIKTALLSALISVIIGILIAYLLCQEKYSKFRHYLLNLPIIVPHIIVVILMIFIFCQTGIISRLCYSIGIIEDSSEFMNLVFDTNGVGVILVYLWKGIPYVILTVYNILKNVSDKLEVVAMNLGASKLQSFRYIILPLAMPSIISSFIILFTFAFGSYEVPFLIGPSTPKALPVYAYVNYISSDFSKRSFAMVINIILSVVSFLLLIIYNKLFNKIYKYKL
ncbi:MAG: ABC transporter permease [Peptostreptococcaceae bacterium]